MNNLIKIASNALIDINISLSKLNNAPIPLYLLEEYAETMYRVFIQPYIISEVNEEPFVLLSTLFINYSSSVGILFEDDKFEADLYIRTSHDDYLIIYYPTHTGHLNSYQIFDRNNNNTLIGGIAIQEKDRPHIYGINEDE